MNGSRHVAFGIFHSESAAIYNQQNTTSICYLGNSITFVYSFKLIISMKKVTVTMNERELKRFESFKEAEKIVRGIKRGLKEVKQSKEGKIQLKTARQLADEI